MVKLYAIRPVLVSQGVPRTRVMIVSRAMDTHDDGNNDRCNSSRSRVAGHSGIPRHRQAVQDCQNTPVRLRTMQVQCKS